MEIKRTVCYSIGIVALLLLSAIIVACSLFDTVKEKPIEKDWSKICTGTTWSVRDNLLTQDDSIPDYFKSISSLFFSSSDSVILDRDQTSQIGPLEFEFTGLSDGILFLNTAQEAIEIKAHFSETLLTLTSPANGKLYLDTVDYFK